MRTFKDCQLKIRVSSAISVPVLSKDLFANHVINCGFDPDKAILENRCQACGLVIPKNHSVEQEPDNESPLMTSDSDSEQDWHSTKYKNPQDWNTEPEFTRYHVPPEGNPQANPQATGITSWIWGSNCLYSF